MEFDHGAQWLEVFHPDMAGLLAPQGALASHGPVADTPRCDRLCLIEHFGCGSVSEKSPVMVGTFGAVPPNFVGGISPWL